MIGRPESKPSHEDASADGAAETDGRGVARRPAEAPVFNPKGIGSNVFLTAAAAIVPLVIVGVAGIKTIIGARKSKR